MNVKLNQIKWLLLLVFGILLVVGIITISKNKSLLVNNTETTKQLEITTTEELETTIETNTEELETAIETTTKEEIETSTEDETEITTELETEAKRTEEQETTVRETTVNETSKMVAVPTSNNRSKKIVAYYAAWAAYSGYSPDKIEPHKVTHINYAFANISDDLKITMGYPDIDPGNFKKLSQIKEKNPSLKTLISVGGWTWSKKFSDVAFTKESRNAFADSCIDFIVEHGFDGIDIDWEYPVSGGMATNTRRPEDRQNFTLLLKTLREKLDARAALDQKYYLLTIAGSAGSGFTTNTEMDSFHQYIDYANIMTYDIHGTWDKYTDFNAPLYSNGDNSSQYKWSVNAGVEAWIAKGFPKEKIILGIPFYGHIYKQVNNVNRGLYQTYSNGNSITYGEISSKYLDSPGFTRYYHGESMVPWLFDGSTFISYEDEDSVRLKVEYIDNKGLGGAFVWELSQDPNEVLLDVISVNLP